jgi:hypothetical protein
LLQQSSTTEVQPYGIVITTNAAGTREVTIDLKRFSVKTSKRIRRYVGKLPMITMNMRLNRMVKCQIDRRCTLDDAQIRAAINEVVMKMTQLREVPVQVVKRKRNGGSKGYCQRRPQLILSR